MSRDLVFENESINGEIENIMKIIINCYQARSRRYVFI